jgi:membrane protein implicated in regulation of membrane protease activity
MINWFSMFANSLWIIALALALAALSYASWRASVDKEKLRSKLNKGEYSAVFSLAGLLFCAGLALTAPSTLQTVLWTILGIGFLIILLARVVQILKNPPA